MPKNTDLQPEGKSRPKERGRPVEKPYPERINASPEEIAEMVLRMPPKKRGEWRYKREKDSD